MSRWQVEEFEQFVITARPRLLRAFIAVRGEEASDARRRPWPTHGNTGRS